LIIIFFFEIDLTNWASLFVSLASMGSKLKKIQLDDECPKLAIMRLIQSPAPGYSALSIWYEIWRPQQQPLWWTLYVHSARISKHQSPASYTKKELSLSHVVGPQIFYLYQFSLTYKKVNKNAAVDFGFFCAFCKRCSPLAWLLDDVIWWLAIKALWALAAKYWLNII